MSSFSVDMISAIHDVLIVPF